MAGWETFTGRVSSAVRGVPFFPGVGSPIVANCLAFPLSAPPLAVSSLDVIAASPIQPCRCPWNASVWTEPGIRPASIVCPCVQFRKDCWLPQKSSSARRLRSGQRFFRNWAQGQSKEAGSWGHDEIRNISGSISEAYGRKDSVDMGALASEFPGNRSAYESSAGAGYGLISFDASRVVPTGPENVPPHVWQPAILYLGRPA